MHAVAVTLFPGSARPVAGTIRGVMATSAKTAATKSIQYVDLSMATSYLFDAQNVLSQKECCAGARFWLWHLPQRSSQSCCKLALQQIRIGRISWAGRAAGKP